MADFPIRLNEKNIDKGGLFSTIALIVVSVLFILLLMFNVLYTRIYIVGSSMKNTLIGAETMAKSGGDYVYICKYIEPKRGDIVVIKVIEGRSLIKRVIGLGGDTVKLEDGALYIKGKGDDDFVLIDEPYVDDELNTDRNKNNFAETVVEEGYVFFLGDNRDNSEDSRGIYGCRPVENIEGVVAGWSLQCKDAITKWNTFFEFTLPELFSAQNNE